MLRNVSKFVGALAAVLILAGAQGFAKENIYKDAKVGQWVQHKAVTVSMGNTTTMTIKKTVTAKDDASITLKMETEMGETKLPAQSSVIKFETEEAKHPEGYKMETIGEGDESITVGGKSYECHWVEIKITMTTPIASVSTTKTWTCKDVPLAHLVKTESSSVMTISGKEMKTTSSMELVGSGE